MAVLIERGVSFPSLGLRPCSPRACSGLPSHCHPSMSFLTDPMIDNNRYCTLEFPVEVNTVLHGFAGYFETVLYRDITLSECLGAH